MNFLPPSDLLSVVIFSVPSLSSAFGQPAFRGNADLVTLDDKLTLGQKPADADSYGLCPGVSECIAAPLWLTDLPRTVGWCCHLALIAHLVKFIHADDYGCS